MQEDGFAGMTADRADTMDAMPKSENFGETGCESIAAKNVDSVETDATLEAENSGETGCVDPAPGADAVLGQENPAAAGDEETAIGAGCTAAGMTAVEKQVAELEAENERLKDSFEPLYTEIGRNFYEKLPGYELAITGAVEKLNQLNEQIHDNYLSTLRLKGIRYCPECEHIVDDETVFCGVCGTRIDPVGEVDEQSVLCGCCGAVNDRKNHFCIKCGQKLQTPGDTFRRCPSCGMQLPLDARFCEECGTRLS